MRVLMIANPFASSVSRRSRARVEEVLGEAHDLTVVDTEARGHATELAGRAVSDGYQAVVVLGGDGTANEVGNGLLGTEVVMAPLPAGSTNVLARTLGVPKSLSKAAPQVAAALTAGTSRRISVGTANGRSFLFHVGLGFDAEVVAQVERRASLKRKLGQSVFVYATFATWLRHFDRHHPHFAMEFPDGDRVDDGYYAICLNSNPYTYLGPRPLNLAPEADGRRGLAAVTVRTVAIGTLTGLFASALGDGHKLRAHPRVDVHADLLSLRVVGHRPFPYQVDGDYLGEVTELSIAYQPERLRVVAF